MNKNELITFISETYNVKPDYPFYRDLDSCIFQQSDNQRWFAVFMKVSYQALGITKNGEVDILTLRYGAAINSIINSNSGIHPAYLMDKDKWITIRLDGEIEQEKLISLIKGSYELTRSRALRKRTIPKQVLKKREQNK